MNELFFEKTAMHFYVLRAQKYFMGKLLKRKLLPVGGWKICMKKLWGSKVSTSQ
jgi:hypothetical protein